MAPNTPEPALVRSGASIYLAAAVVTALETALPGGERLAILPGSLGFVMAIAVALLGQRIPRNALLVIAPIGTTLIAASLAEAHTYSDAAILYSWPTLWVAYFYGNRANVFNVLWIAVNHAVALAVMP